MLSSIVDLAVPDFWNKTWVEEKWHGHASGHRQAVPKFYFSMPDYFGIFVEFLGCLLV